ncbi:MAG: ATP synthase F1 subunit delta [Bacillota bacterium]
MLKGAVATRYAEALFGIASDQNLVGEVEANLRTVLETLEGSRELERVLYHPQIPVALKKNIIREVFRDLLPVTRNFLAVLLDRRREFYLKAIVEAYIELANRTRNIVEVEVTSAVEVPLLLKVNLTQHLGKLTGKEVRVNYRVDPEVIGGLVIRIGNRVVDASVRRHLERLGERIRASKVG